MGIRVIDYDGIPTINTLMGDGSPGCTLSTIGAVGVVSEFGVDLLIADSDGNRILSNPPLATLWSGDLACLPGSTDGPRLSATWTAPEAMVVDNIGNVYVGNLGGSIVRKWTATINDVALFAGGGANPPSFTFQPATSVVLSSTPLFKNFQIIGTSLYFLARSVSTSRIFEIININGAPQIAIILQTNTPGPIANAFCFNPNDGYWYVAYTDFTVYRTTDLSVSGTLFAGTPGVSGSLGDNGPAIDATMSVADDMTIDSGNGLLLLYNSQSVIRRIQL